MKKVITYTKPTYEEVEAYLKSQGHPNPEKYWIEEWLEPPLDREQQYWETIYENYNLCDFDRWMHFEDTINDIEIPWNCFIKIMDALWQEDIDILEM